MNILDIKISCFWNHEFKEIKRLFNPPQLNLSSCKNLEENEILKLIYGITNIELECIKCGDKKIIQSPGKV